MADEIARPKITIVIDAEQAKAALAALKASGSDTSKAFEASLSASMEGASARIKKLADTITGGGATRSLKDLELAIKEAGGVANITGVNFDRLGERIQKLAAAGGTVPASLKGISTAAQQAGASTDKLGQALQGQVSAAASQAASSLGPLGGVITALGPAGLAAAAGIAAAAAAIAALGKLANSAAEWGDKIKDTSIATGMSVESVQRLEHAAKVAEVPLEQVTAAVIKMQRAMIESPEKFAALGLELDKLRAMAPEEQLQAVAEKLQLIEDPALRNATAMGILGKSWADLAPLVMDGLSAMNDAQVMSGETIDKLDELRQETNKLGAAWDKLWLTLGASIAKSPAIVGAIEAITKALEELSRGPETITIPHPDGDPKARFSKSSTPRTKKEQLEVEKEMDAFNKRTGRADSGEQQAIIRLTAELAAEQKKLTDALEGTHTKTVKLTDAQKEAAAAAKTLSDRVKELSGGKMAAAFELDSKAIEKLGGFAKIAANELDGLTKKYAGTANAVPFLMEKVRRGNEQQLSNINSLKTEDATTRQRKAMDILQRSRMGYGAYEIESPGLVVDASNEAHIKGAIAATKDWTVELQNAANAAKFMPPIFGQMLGSIAGVGSAIKGLQGAFKDGLSGLTGGKSLFSGEGFKKLLGNAPGAIGAGIQLAGVGLQLAKTLGDALTTSGPEKAMKEVGKHWGVQISEGLGEQIDKDAKKRGASGAKIGRGDASLLHMKEIIDEGGGVAAVGVDKTIGKLHDLFSAMERGTLTAKDAGKVFDDVFGQVLPEAIDKTTGKLQDNARELLRLARERGVSSKEIDNFLQSQGNAALAGLTTFMKSAEITSEGAALAIGSSIASIFDQMMASGMSRGDAIKAITPAVTELRMELERTGFSGSAAFAALDAQIALMGDEKLGPMVEGIQGLGSAMVNLHNMNLLTQDSFTALSGQVTSTFNSMVAEGADAGVAMATLAPTLQTIWELQQDYGFAVDESTQKLLDQASAAHLVGDEHRSAEDRMASSMERLGSIFELVAEKLGVTREALDALKDKTVNVDVNINTHGQMPTGTGYGDGVPVPEYAGGSGGLQDYGRGTLAMLHGTEGVFTAGQLNSIVKTSARAGGSSGGSIPGGVSDQSYGDMLAIMEEQNRLLSQFPAVLARVTRDAVIFGKINVPRA